MIEKTKNIINKIIKLDENKYHIYNLIFSL